MSDHDAFLRAIAENPHDDAVRLVYADWLEERGDPRGEFIHVQCRLVQMCPDHPDYSELSNREQELLGRHREEWLGELSQWTVRSTFHHGFLEAVTVPVPVYIQHGDKLRERQPQVLLSVDLTELVIPSSTLDHVPGSVAREDYCLPVGWRDRILVLAMADPDDHDLLAKFCFILNRYIEPVAASLVEIMAAVKRHYERTGDGELLIHEARGGRRTSGKHDLLCVIAQQVATLKNKSGHLVTSRKSLIRFC